MFFPVDFQKSLWYSLIMKEGDKFIHTDILGKKWELTYTGTRREVKGCEFEFFIDDKG